MTYAEPNSGLGGARWKKAEASVRLRKSISARSDERERKIAADNRAVKAEFEANQDRLHAEYDDAHPKPTMMPRRRPNG